MYPSQEEYQILEYISPIPQSFLQSFVGSFSTDYPENNHLCLDQLNENCDTILFLLQMIKEGIVDGNQEYSNLLFVALSYLNKIMQENPEKIQELYDQIPVIPSTLLQSTILYILPYAAQVFLEQNNINYFMLLLSCLSSTSKIDDPHLFTLFNSYINYLLSSPLKSQHQVIIALYFAGNLFGVHMESDNRLLLSQLIQENLQFLTKSDDFDDLEVKMYQTIFDQLASFLTSNILANYIPTDMVCESLLNFIKKIVDKYQDHDEFDFDGDIIILKSIIHFLSILYSKVSFNENSESSFIQELVFLLINIYHFGETLVKCSNYCCSKALIQFFNDNIDFLCINSDDQVELDYFVSFINVFSDLSQRDLEEIQFSQENFFFDNFEIELDLQAFSQRQFLTKFLVKIYNDEKLHVLIPILLDYLYEIDLESIQEYHLFLTSQLIRILFEQNDDEHNSQEYKNVLHDIVTKFVPHIFEIISDLLDSPENFFNPKYCCFIFSYYYLISKSHYILNDEDIASYNEDIHIIYSIISNDSDHQFHSILFTYLCMISYILLSRNQLQVDLEQLFLYIVDYSPSCLTNHANMFVVDFSDKTDNFQYLPDIFDNYILQCENLFEDLLPICTSCDDILLVPHEIKHSKDYNYKLSLCVNSIKQITKIIHMIDDFPYDEQRLFDLIHLLSYFENDWEFVYDEVLLMSEIIVKAPNVKTWTIFYVDNIRDSSRMRVYGEWIIPLVYLVSIVPDSIDEELYVYILNEIENFFDTIEVKKYFIYSDDSLMLLNFITRLFELGFLEKVDISQDFLSFFFNIVDITNNSDLDPDFDPLNHLIAVILLKISAILAGFQIQQDDLYKFLNEIVNEELIINDELRFLIIVLIDNFISEDSLSNFNILRQQCLDNTIPKNEEFFTNYYNDSTSFFPEIPHPIIKLYGIEGFIQTQYV